MKILHPYFSISKHIHDAIEVNGSENDTCNRDMNEMECTFIVDVTVCFEVFLRY